MLLLNQRAKVAARLTVPDAHERIARRDRRDRDRDLAQIRHVEWMHGADAKRLHRAGERLRFVLGRIRRPAARCGGADDEQPRREAADDHFTVG